MTLDTQLELAAYLIALGDDELVLGHRDSEWCGLAPILEEDIAFANIALDEIGHATLWYREAAMLLGKNLDRFPDQLVYFRNPAEYRCIQLVEFPRGDWAYSILRQYLFDTSETIRLQALTQSTHGPLADLAQKIYKEEIYHYRHTQAWVTRLGLGTPESNSRMQKALDELWEYTGQLFTFQPGEDKLVEQGILPKPEKISTSWQQQVISHLTAASLHIPEAAPTPYERTTHTTFLSVLLQELQSVARQDPNAEW
jgi:ring-1,2-phenylacetyl-CoA epoxidase subunit PaaC